MRRLRIAVAAVVLRLGLRLRLLRAQALALDARVVVRQRVVVVDCVHDVAVAALQVVDRVRVAGALEFVEQQAHATVGGGCRCCRRRRVRRRRMDITKFLAVGEVHPFAQDFVDVAVDERRFPLALVLLEGEGGGGRRRGGRQRRRQRDGAQLLRQIRRMKGCVRREVLHQR